MIKLHIVATRKRICYTNSFLLNIYKQRKPCISRKRYSTNGNNNFIQDKIQRILTELRQILQAEYFGLCIFSEASDLDFIWIHKKDLLSLKQLKNIS